MRFIDRVFVNPRQRKLKNMETNEVITFEIQDDPENIEVVGVPFNDENMELFRQDLKKDIKVEITTGEIFETNEWVDGKQVFGKKINIGALPNTATKNVAIGIDLSTISIIRLNGISKALANNTYLPLPYPSSTATSSISTSIANTNDITIATGSDRSAYSGYVIIYFIYN